MSTQIQPNFSSQPIYYVMNMQNDHWVKISDVYFNLEEAKSAYSALLKRHPFARLGGCIHNAVEE